MNKPENIKGVLPPSFRAWYQLLNKVKPLLEPMTKIIVWTERHPAGLSQGYEFTVDEIKARAFDELIQGVGNLLNAADSAFESGPLNRQNTLEELYRFLKYRYFQNP